MERLLIVNYIGHIDVLIKIMGVLIGKDNTICIKKKVFSKICSLLKEHNYETGGIIGINSKGVISTFQIDVISVPCLYEYYPNTLFLNNIINNEWSKSNIEFVGFVHSHLHNDKVSRQDVIYSRQILKSNKWLKSVLIGIINLSEKNNVIKWYIISISDILEVTNS